MAGQRFTFVPHPITGTPAALCRKYLEGNDPVTGKPVLQEIIAAITDPLSDDDKKTGFIERPTPRLVDPIQPTISTGCSFKMNGPMDFPSCFPQKLESPQC